MLTVTIAQAGLFTGFACECLCGIRACFFDNHSFRCAQVASFTFTLPGRAAERQGPRLVELRFSLDETGELRVRLVDDDKAPASSHGESGAGAGGDAPASELGVTTQEWVLAGAVGVLALLYLALRLAVRPRLEHGDLATPLF